MPQISVQEMMAVLEAKLSQLPGVLAKDLDFAEVERALQETMAQLMARMLEPLLADMMQAADFIEQLKRLGGRLGMRLKDYRRVRVRLSGGQEIEVTTPYFIKATAQRKRRQRGPNGRGAYLGLEALGFIEGGSAGLVDEVVSLALLGPSFEVARSVLARRGIGLDVKTIRRFCQALGQRGLAVRGLVSLDGQESLQGRTLVIGIDGGRLRERRRKRGRRRAEQKRQGYHTDWKEPKWFTIYIIDAEGRSVKDVAPLHDATLDNHEGLFGLLERYLGALPLAEVDHIVFCGDGAPWIWSGVETLIERLGLAPGKVHQVLDYTHAKQNLRQILEWLPARLRTDKVERQWKAWLWQGDLQALEQAIKQSLTGQRQRQRAVRKGQNYFAPHRQRLQYQHFENQGLPCGSGSVESAIRRVINLRLKAPGTFWTKEMGECFLFLRSQLLSGRWEVMLDNLTHQTAKQLHSLAGEVSANDDQWLKAA